MAEPNALDRLCEKIEHTVMTNIRAIYIGEIKKLEPPTATIQPMAKIKSLDGKTITKQNTVEKVGFMYIPFKNNVYLGDRKGDSYIKTQLDYKQGDQVIVGVFDNDNQLYDVEKPKQFNSPASRTHSIDYSVVLGRLARKEDFKKPKGSEL